MPDKAGTRAARTVQFQAMLIAWRKRNQLSREEAARLLCCTASTIGQWEHGRALQQGVSLPAIVAFIEGGAL